MKKSWSLSSIAGAGVLIAALLAPISPAAAQDAAPAPDPALASSAAVPPASTPTLTTWGHDDAVATTGAIPADKVRASEFYEASVARTAQPGTSYSSFVYMSVPRSGKDKMGYTEQDGAEFSSGAGMTMSWSSFEYGEDVWTTVRLKTGQEITSVDQVTVRPTDLGLEKQLVDSSTVRIKVPFSPDGMRFSVEFDPQLITSYNDMSGASGVLTESPGEGHRAVHTEPRNSMLVFANPVLSAADTERYIPGVDDGPIHYPRPGLVNDLGAVTEEIVYFRPGTYYMGSDHHAVLPENVKWVYLAPGAYVKGAFRFLHKTQSQYKVTGLGVLSGEQYVYEPDTNNGYQHSVADNCHSSCVKMLQFESSNTGQALDLQGVTINEPPYHSFVVYAHEGEGAVEVGVENFRMNVQNYKQVGSWYWQTDGIELYPEGRMRNTFFHANDDVLKLYHSDVQITNTVVWKNENGPVMQWGWVPRTIDDVTVANTDIIHNRMYWKDVKYNTCVFNSSSHWEDMNAKDRADTGTTVKNMRFTDTRVEGMVNCGIRVFALSNTENIEIDGFSVDAWNGLDYASQGSLLKLHSDKAGQKVGIGNEMSEGKGLLLHNYTVGGSPVLKAGDNWWDTEPGRLNFDGDAWDGWNASADGQPSGPAPALSVNQPADGTIAESRRLTVNGASDAPAVTVSVNGERAEAPVVNGSFSLDVNLTEISNRIVVTATGENGAVSVIRRAVTALGSKVGSLSDQAGDDHGPGDYTYPTDSAFNPGSFDLLGLDVYQDGDTVRFLASTAGPINNPWGGSGMSTQRLNIYLQDGESTTVAALLPGTNTSAAGAWKYAIVADGRYSDSRLGAGVYDAELQRAGDVHLAIDPSGRIIVSVAVGILGGLDLRNLGYQVSMFSDAEESEGLGNVRPVYSAECARGVGCPWFVGPYRIGGGAGVWTDAVESRDTETSDSNALDIISGNVPQAEVMDWTQGPVVVPYVRLDTAGTVIDAQFAVNTGKTKGSQILRVIGTNHGATSLELIAETDFGLKKLGLLAAGETRSYPIETQRSWLPASSLTITATAPDGASRKYILPYLGTKQKPQNGGQSPH